MLRSLVGSEMCIRDRHHPHQAGFAPKPSGWRELGGILPGDPLLWLAPTSRSLGHRALQHELCRRHSRPFQELFGQERESVQQRDGPHCGHQSYRLDPGSRLSIVEFDSGELRSGEDSMWVHGAASPARSRALARL
eukprot:TRINITY_DN28146_c0_g1_i3.p2 TRINITY_DN28146_c0_g1~~TRINITY_DN28146_c0_g1_i3.p2  ORF type:complete len:136 (-),score=20.79 TRINITY_DN28146_c0_g1_i3:387-794(-)